MRRHTTAALCAVLALFTLPLVTARAASASDAFGYTRAAAGDPGGPAFDWSLPGGATIVTLRDDEARRVDLGFTFEFYGARYTRARLVSNGFLTFNARGETACCNVSALPTAGAPGNLVAGFWADLDPFSRGQVSYATTGTAPARRFVARFEDVELCCATGATASFQMVLEEGTNAIEMHYDSTPACAKCAGGIENATGTIGIGHPVAGLDGAAVRYELPSGVTCPSVAPAPLAFGAPRYIDTTRAGGEPVSVVAQDGAILVSAHAGTTHLFRNPAAAAGAADFGAGYANQTLNWRSADGGDTWRYIGTEGAPAGPHSPTSTGFSDPDFSMDYGGRIYNTEIDLANVSVYSSTDDGQSFPFATPVAASGDRPWLTGQEPDEVFLYVNTLRQLWRSTTGGLAFTLVNTDIAAGGKLFNDPLNPNHGLIGADGTAGIAISPDDGETWQSHYGANLGAATQFFGVPGVDRAGWVYLSAAGGYGGANDTNPTGEVTFDFLNRVTGSWWGTVEIPSPAGDALWPWMIAGDDGRAAVVWYQSLSGKPDEFYIYAAYTTNAHGSTVVCSDGVSRFIPPQFASANASGRVIHRGKICLQGTNCNLVFDYTAADRRLGDFFTVSFTLDGTLFIASGDSMLSNPLGGPKPVANPIFIKQTAGDPMLATPIPARPTRCLTPLPLCPEVP